MVTQKFHNTLLRHKLSRFASPPTPNEAATESPRFPSEPLDSVVLSQRAQCKPRRGSLLGKGLSLLGLGLGAYQALAPVAAQALEREDQSLAVQGSVIDALVRQVLSESAQSDHHLSNPRFSGFQELRDLGAEQTFAEGEEGPHIEAVQTALIDMGFAINAGATGGLYGQTLNALNNFRAGVDLERSSTLDRATLQKLDELAPPPGLTLSQHPTASFPPAQYVNGQPVRVLVNIDERRLFYYDREGHPEEVFPVATGANTERGLKVVNYKYNDPTEVAMKFWPESGGRAFGTRLIDLKWLDAQTGETRSTDEEIHGTYTRNSIGGNASSGCIRLYNEDVESLYPRLTAGDLVVFQ